MTPVFTCGFECGAAGTVGQHWTLSGTCAFSTSTVNNGLRSLRAPPAGDGSYTYAATSGTLRVQRVYINVVSAPTANSAIAGCRTNSLGHLAGLVFKTSDSKYYAGTDNNAGTFTFGATGTTLSAGWHLVDIRLNVVANPWVIEVSIDGVALGTNSPANAADTFWREALGAGSTATFDIYYDDFVASATSGDFPIGAGKVLSFVPNADGTHTATTTTIVKGTAATPVGGNVAGSTDVFNWVNARPIGGGATDATRLVNQQTLGTTLYAEENFEDTTEVNAPRAVEVLTVDQQAATTVGGFSTKLNDNGTEDVIITRSAAGVVTDRYVTKQYATMVGGGAWTLARFNALKIRFGYSGDATPDQYWRGAMIEAEFPTSLDASAFDRPFGESGKNQMNQLLAQ